MKKCYDCQLDLPLENFLIDKKGKHITPCKACRRIRIKVWRAANPDKVKILKKRSYDKNREKRIAATKAWKEKNRDRVQAWKEANPERFAEYNKRYKEYQRQWRQDNKVHIRLKAAAQRRKTGHPYDKKIDVSDLLEAMMCGICSTKIQGDYHIDHIKPLKHGGAHTRSNLQLAHPLCNLRKGAKLEVIAIGAGV